MGDVEVDHACLSVGDVVCVAHCRIGGVLLWWVMQSGVTGGHGVVWATYQRLRA